MKLNPLSNSIVTPPCPKCQSQVSKIHARYNGHYRPRCLDCGKTFPSVPRLLDGVTVAYLDASFYDGRELADRDISQIGHPLMVDTMRRLKDRALAEPGLVRFIHLNHNNPALHDPELQALIERRGFRVARRGERLPL